MGPRGPVSASEPWTCVHMAWRVLLGGPWPRPRSGAGCDSRVLPVAGPVAPSSPFAQRALGHPVFLLLSVQKRLQAKSSRPAPSLGMCHQGVGCWFRLLLPTHTDGLVTEVRGISEVGCRVKAAAGPDMMRRAPLWALPHAQPLCVSVLCRCQLSLEGGQPDTPWNAA